MMVSPGRTVAEAGTNEASVAAPWSEVVISAINAKPNMNLKNLTMTNMYESSCFWN